MSGLVSADVIDFGAGPAGNLVGACACRWCDQSSIGKSAVGAIAPVAPGALMMAEDLTWPSRASAEGADSVTPASSRDSTDLADLFRQHHVALVRLAVLLVRDRAAGEDIVQDVFARIHARRAESFDPAGAIAYLRRAVVNG